MAIRRKLNETTAPAPVTNGGLVPAAFGAPGELVPGYGNITHEDLVVPRIKLLQGMSEECKPTGGSHPQGHWFHTSEGKTIGTDLTVVSLGVKKTVEVWPPRDSREAGEGIMAKSSDGIRWDEGYANREFVVEYDDGSREVWRTGNDVKSSGLCDFQGGKPPKAGYTYRLALWLPEYPDYHASLYIASRTATQGVTDMNGRVRSRSLGGVPFWRQQYLMKAFLRKGGRNLSWYVPMFENLPPLPEGPLADELKARAEAIYRSNVVGTDEAERASGAPAPRAKVKGTDRSQGSDY